MENCYFSMFKGDTENSNLPYAGYVQYRVKITNQPQGMTLYLTEGGTLILLDGVWTTNGSREINISAGKFYPNSINITPDDQSQEFCNILVPKYTCYAYGNTWPKEGENTIDLTGYKWLQEQQTFEFPPRVDLTALSNVFQPNVITLKGLEYAPLDKFDRLHIANVRLAEPVDITNLGAAGNLISITMGSVSVNIYGSLDNLGKSNVTWSNDTFLPNTKNVSIDLVNFVNNRRAAGATTGTITFRYLGNLTVKASGVVLDVPVQPNNVLVWDASSITLDGNPIS